MQRIKVGVVGVGHLGKEHARIYSQNPLAELAGICDIDKSKAEKAKELGTKFFKSYEDLLPHVEAVSIAVPTSKHYEISKVFLEHGKHVLVEKPIASRLEEADELIELARAKKLALEVGHIERYNAGFREVEKMAKEIRFIEIHRLGPFTPRISDCGVVLDLMIHDLDILLTLVDSEIETFDAIGIHVLTPFEDIANVRIKFKNGAIANLTASRLTPERQRKIRIFQPNAYISLDYGTQRASIFRKEGLSITRNEIDIQQEEPLKSELNYFLKSIKDKTNFGKPDIGARNALELALKITENIKKNLSLVTAGLENDSKRKRTK